MGKRPPHILAPGYVQREILAAIESGEARTVNAISDWLGIAVRTTRSYTSALRKGGYIQSETVIRPGARQSYRVCQYSVTDLGAQVARSFDPVRDAEPEMLE